MVDNVPLPLIRDPEFMTKRITHAVPRFAQLAKSLKRE